MNYYLNKKYVIIALIVCVVTGYFILNKKNELFPHNISAPEDLMREHGLLNRVLLIYEEVINRIDRKDVFPRTELMQALEIIKKFIEEYHEKIEEDHIFPLFEAHNQEINLVTTLREQHVLGRTITRQLQTLVASAQYNEQVSRKIKELLHNFITMYRPHEAREDTVIFPQVRSLVSEKEYAALAEICEDIEEQLFGEHGFESILQQVEDIEKELGIYTLEQFSPQI